LQHFRKKVQKERGEFMQKITPLEKVKQKGTSCLIKLEGTEFIKSNKIYLTFGEWQTTHYPQQRVADNS